MSATTLVETVETTGAGGVSPLPFLFLVVLLVLNAFFAASEIAVVSLKDVRVRRMAGQGHKAARLLVKLLDDPGRFLATIQVGITLAGFLASAFAADYFAEPLMAWYGRQAWSAIPAQTMRPVAVVGITLVLSFVTLVCGELVPKRIAMRHSEGVALRVARPIAFVARLARPFIWLLNATTNTIVRQFGIDPHDNARNVSEEEIRMLVDLGREKGVIEATEKEMIENVFEFNNKNASDIMVHRSDIVALPLDATPGVCQEVLKQCGFSRLPVYQQTIDDVVGILNARDFLLRCLDDPAPELRPLLRPALFVPETIRADALFRDMQRDKQSMAIVLDEYGGTAGLLSVEDLLEEIVGELYDEYDRVDEQPDCERLDEQTWRMRGSMALEDVCEHLQRNLPRDDHNTLGGLIFGAMGLMPDVGATLDLPEFGLALTIESMDGRRVGNVLVRNTAAAATPPPEDAG